MKIRIYFAIFYCTYVVFVSKENSNNKQIKYILSGIAYGDRTNVNGMRSLLSVQLHGLYLVFKLTYRQPAQNGVLADQLCRAIYCIHLSIMSMQIAITTPSLIIGQ